MIPSAMASGEQVRILYNSSLNSLNIGKSVTITGLLDAKANLTAALEDSFVSCKASQPCQMPVIALCTPPHLKICYKYHVLIHV